MDKVEGVKAWEGMYIGGLESAIRKNPDYLKNVSDYSTRTGINSGDIVSTAKNNENGVEQFLDELEDTPASGHWDLDPFQRGRNIEDDLGQNLPEPFKTIDIYDDEAGIATSIKSIDLDAKTYQIISKFKSRLNKYADDLNKFTFYQLGDIIVGNAENPINSKILKIAIPRAPSGEQLNAINEIVQSWPNINIVTIIVP